GQQASGRKACASWMTRLSAQGGVYSDFSFCRLSAPAPVLSIPFSLLLTSIRVTDDAPERTRRCLQRLFVLPVISPAPVLSIRLLY
ncbi:hypothetical protein K6U71_17920, partial [Vibrio alginolyticus]|nr:hypothetical protein [Vibrio alginolyticus]